MATQLPPVPSQLADSGQCPHPTCRLWSPCMQAQVLQTSPYCFRYQYPYHDCQRKALLPLHP
ncbi:hypothetical protein PSHT_12111 [Puccinia striiformis]|uniref:Uncharacterized protein n=2 Tax=Puccinia striiformis TaxID=27350 RepID=A0A2S4UYR6_9BASI|nr:hypothetical protein PSTT_12561 [Puccinia striiformis]POW02407.1 hypothetical protein PSHT_12111 [Puccinia striiformis]